MIGLRKHLKGNYVIEPFPPGSYAEYQIMEDGKAKLLESGKYYSYMEKPSFNPLVSWDGKESFSKAQFTFFYLDWN